MSEIAHNTIVIVVTASLGVVAILALFGIEWLYKWNSRRSSNKH